MAEYDFIAGPRKGKVWKEKYYLRNNKNFIQEAKKYIPINSQWLTKEEFKNYIISLLDKGIPQIYVLQELPEELFPYALIFVQNQQGTSIYVDKEGIRTQINIGGNANDAVDIVNEIPENLRNNTIYFVNQPDSRNKNKDILDYDLYVCENNELKQIELYSVDSTLQMTNNTISMPNKLDSAKNLGLYKTAYDIQGRCTNVEAYTIPHLYTHHYHYARQDRGNINLFIYSTSSTQLSSDELEDYLFKMNCIARDRIYPACGESQYSNAMVDGIYLQLNYGGKVIHVVSHNGSNEYYEEIGNYTYRYSCNIVQIF